MKKFFKIAFVIFIVLALVNLITIQDDTEEKVDLHGDASNSELVSSEEFAIKEKVTPETRSFMMGFTPFPPNLTVKAVNDVYDFIDEHGDLIVHHLDNGAPWVEALAKDNFSEHLTNDWKTRLEKSPRDSEIMLVMTPLNFDRDGLALYWGKKEGINLPSPWKGYALNNTNVKKAYVEYVKRGIEYFNPKYLGIGIEANILLHKKPELWSQYIDLNKYVYDELKKDYPSLTIFTSVQYEFLRGLEDGTKNEKEIQSSGVKEILKHSDILALSTYHYGVNHNPPTDNYFDLALSFNKPIGIAETGAGSRDFSQFGITTEGTYEDQAKFVTFILSEASKNNFLFVNNWVAVDLDNLLDDLPMFIRQIAKGWAYTGLQDSEYKDKESLEVWDSYLDITFSNR